MGSKNDTRSAELIIEEAARWLPTTRRQAVRNALRAQDDPDLVSEGQAAQLLGVSRSHLYRWRTGALHTSAPFPFHTFTPPGTSSVRYRRSEVTEYVLDAMTDPEHEESQAS